MEAKEFLLGAAADAPEFLELIEPESEDIGDGVDAEPVEDIQQPRAQAQHGEGGWWGWPF